MRVPAFGEEGMLAFISPERAFGPKGIKQHSNKETSLCMSLFFSTRWCKSFIMFTEVKSSLKIRKI
jgi:hypothetical protein